jgi:hypothetical protein
MEQFIILVLVGITSCGASIIGRRKLGLSWNGLQRAIDGMLQSVRVTLVFFAANLVAGTILILAGRFFLREFVSLYLVNDLALLVLSLFQGLVFQWWRYA